MINPSFLIEPSQSSGEMEARPLFKNPRLLMMTKCFIARCVDVSNMHSSSLVIQVENLGVNCNRAARHHFNDLDRINHQALVLLLRILIFLHAINDGLPYTPMN